MTARRAAILLLALALAVRVGFILATPGYHPIHDDHDYDRLACAVVQGAGYAGAGPDTPASGCGKPWASVEPTAFRAPLWPLTLAGVYAVSDPVAAHHRWIAARIVLALLGTLAVALMGLVARMLWGRRAGLVALALGAVCVPLVVVGGTLITETLFVALELAAVAAALTAGRSPHALSCVLATGALTGAAMLARSNAVVLLVPMAIAVWSVRTRLWERRGVSAAALGATALLVVAPWTIRNAVSMHDFVPLTTEAGSAFAGTYNPDAAHARHFPGTWKPPRKLPSVAPQLRGELGEAARARRLVAFGAGYAARHPGYPLSVLARNTARLFGLGGRDWRRLGATTISLPAAAADASAIWLVLVAPLVLAGAVAAWRRGPRWIWLVPALMLLSAALFVGEARFRAPVDPFLVLLAACGGDALLTWLRPPAASNPRPASRAPASAPGSPSPSGT
jgi:4-amino-4-deoxy-L-arabinose transferase-like glycosyltransferase